MTGSRGAGLGPGPGSVPGPGRGAGAGAGAGVGGGFGAGPGGGGPQPASSAVNTATPSNAHARCQLITNILRFEIVFMMFLVLTGRLGKIKAAGRVLARAPAPGAAQGLALWPDRDADQAAAGHNRRTRTLEAERPTAR